MFAQPASQPFRFSSYGRFNLRRRDSDIQNVVDMAVLDQRLGRKVTMHAPGRHHRQFTLKVHMSLKHA